MHDLSDLTPHDKKLYVWKHNAMFGALKRVQKLLDVVPQSSMTIRARTLWLRTQSDLEGLIEEVWTNRKEPDGSVVKIQHKKKNRSKE